MNSTYTTKSFQIGRGNAQSAQITIKSNFQNLTIYPATNPDTLIEGKLDLIGEMELETSGDTHKVVTLGESQPHGNFHFSHALQWEIYLAPGIPLSLSVGVNSGEAQLHLDTLSLNHFKLNMNSGESHTLLPATPEDFSAYIHINSGDTYIQSAGSLKGAIQLHNNSGDVNFVTGEHPAFQLKLHNNSGDMVLHIPEATTLKIDAGHINSGDVIVPAGFEHVQKRSFHGGLWQSADVSTFDIGIDAFINSGNIRVVHSAFATQ